jgi:hypothetical protein
MEGLRDRWELILNALPAGVLPNKALHLTVGRGRPPAGERQGVRRTFSDDEVDLTS